MRVPSEYVVKSGADYVRMASADGAPSRWTVCQRCAAHWSIDRAHEVAHGSGRKLRVVRIKPKTR